MKNDGAIQIDERARLYLFRLASARLYMSTSARAVVLKAVVWVSLHGLKKPTSCRSNEELGLELKLQFELDELLELLELESAATVMICKLSIASAWEMK